MAARIDCYERYVKATNEVPSEFDFYRWSAGPSDDVPDGYCRLEGAVAPFATRGPRKGRRNWKKMDKATNRVFFVQCSQVEQWCKENSICTDCNNTGQNFVSWHHETGTTYAPCKCGIEAKAESP